VLTVTRSDVSTYFSELYQGESVVPVSAGEQLTEFQLLEGLMLPSGSNLAVLLATWDQGSVPAFVNRMNARASALGMAATHYADVSGFSTATVSTPADLITLAQTAMKLPVFAQIVAQPQATLPIAGVIRNLNTLLGTNGVIGIKTGHTDQAGGCLVFAADFPVEGRTVRVYGAVLGQPNFLAGAFSAATSLLNALRPALHLRAVVARGDIIGHYSTPWGESGPIMAAATASWVLLDGTTIEKRVSLGSLQPGLPAGSRVGSLDLSASTQHVQVPLVTELAINGPDLGWRLTRGL
jgi:D-alanyl-D-alanine carboxypeptidase (penicillin-binding protein 5/6)